jgi:hypothetical protein
MLAVLVLAAFLAGYIPLFLKNRELTFQTKQVQENLTELQDRLQVARLQNDLGIILAEADQDNFGHARERSSRFFNEVQQAASTVRNSELGARLTAILRHRDTITSDLTSLNPDVKAKLRSLYLEFVQIDLPAPARN